MRLQHFFKLVDQVTLFLDEISELPNRTISYRKAHIFIPNVVEELGGLIYDNTEALFKQKYSNNKMIVSTKKGESLLDHIVIGTNGYSVEFSEVIKKSVVPVESIMVSTETLSKDIYFHRDTGGSWERP